MAVRHSILAGTWYPGRQEELALLVDEHLAGGTQGPTPIALVAPHAGLAYSGPTAGQAYARLAGCRPERVIVLAPSHGGYPGAHMRAVEAYETPLGSVPLPGADEARELREATGLGSDPAADQREHSLEIQLPYLQRVLPEGWRLVPIVVGEMSPAELRRLGRRLRSFYTRRTLVVASTDFTHYGRDFGYVPFPPDDKVLANLAQLDGRAASCILERDPEGLLRLKEETGITMCGYRPVLVLLHALPADARGEDLAYATSGELCGTREHSVSYRALAFGQDHPELALSAALEEELLREARAEMTRAVHGEPTPASTPTGEGAELQVDIFVTLRLRHNGRLRGCIGSVGTPRPLWESLRSAARGAALRDTRFAAVTSEELGEILVEVSVLTSPRPIQPPEIEVGRHGLGITLEDRRGVFLPKVAEEHGWSVEAYLRALCKKATLPEDAWQDPRARLQSFEALACAEALR